MKPIASLLERKHPKLGYRTERGDLITYFLEKINAARKGTKYKPFTARAMAVKLSHLKLQDLYYLKSVCEDAERDGFGFSKKFWYELKPKEV